MTTRVSAPLPIMPRGLQRQLAALYVGISATKFDQLVAAGRMPPPRRIDGRKVWDVRELDRSFDALPHEALHGDGDTGNNPLDDVTSI